MVSACKVPLPPGKIGVTFKGTPPVVVAVTEFSPLVGKIKEGYVFDGLYLKDGTEFVDLTTAELVKTLNQHMGEEGRKMKLKMVLPDATQVTLPAGDIGLLIQGTPPTIVKIHDESLLAKIRPGLAVDALILEDGTKYTGLSTEELHAYLKDDFASEGRVLALKKIASSTLSPRSTTLPQSKEVMLPTGELGTTFNGKPFTIVGEMTADSPMRGAFREGLVADSLTFPDGTTCFGLDPADLTSILAKTAETKGRSMVLKNPSSKNLSKKPTTKVMLPAGELGLTFAGTPATVFAVAEDSPLAGKVSPGLVVQTICLADSSEFDGLESEEAMDLIKNAEMEGGWILLSNDALPDEIEVTLPAGKVGVAFKGLAGQPPIVGAVSDDSPVKGFLKPGMVVDVLSLEGGMKVCELDTKSLAQILTKNMESTGRVVLLKNPATAVMSKMEDMPLPDEQEITLPAGQKLGFMLVKGPPAMISKVKDESPLKGEIMAGLAIDTVTLPDGQVFMELNSAEFVRLVNENKTEGIVLLLKNPALGNMTKKPDSKEVAIPAGRLDVVFKGTPPIVVKLNASCPVKKELTVGLFVDMVTLSDGTVLSGLSASELVAVLKESADSEGRTILLKNPATKTPSEKNTILPDEKTVVLPTGSIGVSFKGTPPMVSRLIDSSPVKGIFRLGMVVDTLDIPGESDAEAKSYAGMSPRELVKIMKENANIEGRKIVLKNPATATLSERKGDFGEGPDDDTDASVRG